MVDRRPTQVADTTYRVVEICAGAGGQALGLEKAGFEHVLAVELDSWACQTLRLNRSWDVAEGDVADPNVWDPEQYRGVDLLAGGVPCPPFSIAGKQLGASDERDLFAWAVAQVEVVRPRALMLENVRGLSQPRFAAYRQRVLDQLAGYGYVAEWRLLQASDFGVAQLRPRFVLVALRADDAAHFYWPEPIGAPPTVGEVLRDLMGAKGWQHLDNWVAMADDIGPTLVGGSKKHGGADLGPTRAKAAWRILGVNGMGIADDVPGQSATSADREPPKLTIEMVARLQGWATDEWRFAGRKTAQYRQIGNAFPPPVAEAIGRSLIAAFDRSVPARGAGYLTDDKHDPLYKFLRDADDFVSSARLLAEFDGRLNEAQLKSGIANLSRDFVVVTRHHYDGTQLEYRLGEFLGFIGQESHRRHDYLVTHRSTVS